MLKTLVATVMPVTKSLPALRCPFCGSASVRLIECDESQFAVCCDGCLAIGPGAESGKQATDRWNRAPRNARECQAEERKEHEPDTHPSR